ncbi:hypothetical protein LX32DRAFT_716656, partial [Colletotrichum zoysiae]
AHTKKHAVSTFASRECIARITSERECGLVCLGGQGHAMPCHAAHHHHHHHLLLLLLLLLIPPAASQDPRPGRTAPRHAAPRHAMPRHAMPCKPGRAPDLLERLSRAATAAAAVAASGRTSDKQPVDQRQRSPESPRRHLAAGG